MDHDEINDQLVQILGTRSGDIENLVSGLTEEGVKATLAGPGLVKLYGSLSGVGGGGRGSKNISTSPSKIKPFS